MAQGPELHAGRCRTSVGFRTSESWVGRPMSFGRPKSECWRLAVGALAELELGRRTSVGFRTSEVSDVRSPPDVR